MVEISFIVPMYNVQEYILECIESILTVEKISYEIIVVNDGSTDSSVQKIQCFLSLPEVKLINQENRGLSGARNTGLRNASGKYVSFIDSDDKINPIALIDLYKRGSKTSPDIIVGDYLYWVGEELIVNKKTLPSDEEMNGKTLLAEYYGHCIDSVTCRNLYSRDFLLSRKLFFVEGLFFEDVEWMPKAFYYAHTVSYHKIAFYHYRYRPNSITTSEFSKKKFEDCLRISSMKLSLAADMEKIMKQAFLKISFYCFYKALTYYPNAYVEQQNSEMKSLLEHIARKGSFSMQLLACAYRYFPKTTCAALRRVGAIVRFCKKEQRS